MQKRFHNYFDCLAVISSAVFRIHIICVEPLFLTATPLTHTLEHETYTAHFHRIDFIRLNHAHDLRRCYC